MRRVGGIDHFVFRGRNSKDTLWDLADSSTNLLDVHDPLPSVDRPGQDRALCMIAEAAVLHKAPNGANGSPRSIYYIAPVDSHGAQHHEASHHAAPRNCWCTDSA